MQLRLLLLCCQGLETDMRQLPCRCVPGRPIRRKHNIPGRSRMRKPELVAALEAKLGWVQRRQPPPAAQ